VSKEDQLQWERRLAAPAAIAAFGSGLLLLAATVVLISLSEDRLGIEPGPDSLLSVNESPGTLIAAAVLQALAAILLILVFYYLFRAILARNAQIPRWFVYLIVLGPLMYAAGQVIGAIDRVDVAETFADRSYSFEDANPNDDPDLTRCPAIRGEIGADCAEELLRDMRPNGLGLGLGLAGSVSVAFLFVMVPLRARRVGLLSPFMGILGVIAGVLLVLPLIPNVPVIVQAFWLGAIGALFLGRWPGGRGPAWGTGEAEPWPTPAQRRGLVTPGGGDEAQEPDAPPEPEPVPERPSSRKRKRKRG
jgi:hypothetical protein